MQHRFSLPPLEVQDFPQSGFFHMKMPESSSNIHGNTNENDILQEILSVAHASQELTNQDTWGGNYLPADDFSFPSHAHQIHDHHASSSSFMEKSRENQNTRSLEIGDVDEEFKNERMVENLRWVGMSSKDLDQVTLCPFQNYY